MKTETFTIDWTRVNNDVNGNPRYVCHFLALLTDKDEEQIKQDFAASLAHNPFKMLDFKYETALQRARKLGGRKYHNKKFGGGIVFQSYNIGELTKSLGELVAN